MALITCRVNLLWVLLVFLLIMQKGLRKEREEGAAETSVMMWCLGGRFAKRLSAYFLERVRTMMHTHAHG